MARAATRRVLSWPTAASKTARMTLRSCTTHTRAGRWSTRATKRWLMNSIQSRQRTMRRRCFSIWRIMSNCRRRGLPLMIKLTNTWHQEVLAAEIPKLRSQRAKYIPAIAEATTTTRDIQEMKTKLIKTINHRSKFQAMTGTGTRMAGRCRATTIAMAGSRMKPALSCHRWGIIRLRRVRSSPMMHRIT